MTEAADQKQFWNDEAGPAWARHAAQMDALMAPVLAGVLNRAQISEGAKVLDIGCGSGISAMHAARLAGETGHVTGCDVSETLLALARKRAAAWKLDDRVDFLLADAQSHAFEEGAFTHLISRFGVMFFEDPQAAFANMIKALAPGGQLSVAVWGQIPQNLLFTAPAANVRAVFGEAPPRPDPDGPGPFAFRDPARLQAILEQVGLEEVTCQIIRLPLTPSGSASDLAKALMEIGPAERAVSYFKATEGQHEDLRQRLIRTLEGFNTSEGLRLPAEINYFTARRA